MHPERSIITRHWNCTIPNIGLTCCNLTAAFMMI